MFGLAVWLLIGISVWSSTTTTSSGRIRSPSVKDYRKMQTVALKLERLVYAFEPRANLVLRLRKTADNASDQQQPWSADNPVARAIHWLAVTDEEDRLSLQRYALAVLYFYTSSSSSDDSSWTECAPTSKTCSTTSVLTTMSSECNWYGITCSPQGQITRIEWMSNNLSSSSSGTTATDWPDEMILLQQLELLWWSDNPLLHITAIPTFLGQYLTNLQSLSLHRTALQGSLPDSIYQLTNLMSLRLYETNLTGSISPDIFHLGNNLGWLWLHGNRLTGSIPDELGQLTKLEGLTRKYNSSILSLLVCYIVSCVNAYNIVIYIILLTHFAFSFVMTLKYFSDQYIYNISVHDNKFSNEPPDTLCDMDHLETYWIDCVTNEPPTCTCCSKCFVKRQKYNTDWFSTTKRHDIIPIFLSWVLLQKGSLEDHALSFHGSCSFKVATCYVLCRRWLNAHLWSLHV